MSSRLLSTSAAARYLEVAEHTVRNWADAGLIPCERTAKNWRRFALDDLEQFAIRRGLGVTARAQRTIVLVGKGLGEQAASIEAAGLHAHHSANVIDGIREVQQKGQPILVVNLHVAQQELYLLKALLGETYMCVIAQNRYDVSHELEPQAAVIPPMQLRALVQWAWGAVKSRHDAVSLGL